MSLKPIPLALLSALLSCSALVSAHTAAESSPPAELGSAAAAPAAPSTPLTACGPSSQVNALFGEFGRTGKMPPALGQWLNDPAIQTIEPYQAFDNVYNVGICWVSSWLIQTSDGLVLIDSLYGPYTDRLLANVRKLGFDPKDIRYVLLTHGHFDHVGGVAALKAQLPAKFVMSREGWQESLADARASQGKPNAWTMPLAADLEVKDGDVITVGDTRIQVLATPGHTWGTTSYAFDVKDGARSHRAITIGGLGLNAIDGPDQVKAYLRSIDRIQAMVNDAAQPLAVHLTAHPFSTGLTEARAALQSRQPGEAHPLVDAAALNRQLNTLRQGATQRLAVEQAKKGAAASR